MSLTLTELSPAPGSKRRAKRVGRGIASGHGKTSNRGHRGQKQRSGYSKRFGFEGGQTPLYRRLPKIHNFDQVVRRKWVEVNVGKLNDLPDGSVVNPASLVEFEILDKETDSLRILGNGDLKIKLTVKAHHVSKGAKSKIEGAGGTCELIEAAARTRAMRGQKVEKAKKSK